MATKTATKTHRNAKTASKAKMIKATKKNATVAKESKQADKKLSQIEAAVAIPAKSKEPINCKEMVEDI
jgi:hypothetical protein